MSKFVFALMALGFVVATQTGCLPRGPAERICFGNQCVTRISCGPLVTMRDERLTVGLSGSARSDGSMKILDLANLGYSRSSIALFNDATARFEATLISNCQRMLMYRPNSPERNAYIEKITSLESALAAHLTMLEVATTPEERQAAMDRFFGLLSMQS